MKKYIDILEEIKTARAAITDTAKTEKEMERAEKAKNNGKKTIYAAAMRILKNSKTYYCGAREALQYSYNDGLRVSVCDGMRLVQFNAETAPELPALPDKMEYVNVARIIDSAADNDDGATLPAAEDLKNYIKIEKAKKKAAGDRAAPVYILTTESGQNIYINANYLLDIMECLPGAIAKASSRGPLYAVYFESENGRAMLCTIRPEAANA